MASWFFSNGSTIIDLMDTEEDFDENIETARLNFLFRNSIVDNLHKENKKLENGHYPEKEPIF